MVPTKKPPASIALKNASSASAIVSYNDFIQRRNREGLRVSKIDLTYYMPKKRNFFDRLFRRYPLETRIYETIGYVTIRFVSGNGFNTCYVGVTKEEMRRFLELQPFNRHGSIYLEMTMYSQQAQYFVIEVDPADVVKIWFSE